MIYKTPFGHLKPTTQIVKTKVDAVQRALQWCETIVASTQWTPVTQGKSISLRRTIHDQTIEIFPLEAARMDFGMKSRFHVEHLPIHLNNENACVRPILPRSRPLHSDMIASMILLLGRADFNPASVPRTLHSILTEQQLTSLPPPPAPRGAYIPGRPSTSGREFLPESQILELAGQHLNANFTVQFEKRDGTLRNMTARVGAWTGPDGEERDTNRVRDAMSYDPSEYNLKTVFDMEKSEYRNIATDRVTQISIGGDTLRSASAES